MLVTPFNITTFHIFSLLPLHGLLSLFHSKSGILPFPEIVNTPSSDNSQYNPFPNGFIFASIVIGINRQSINNIKDDCFIIILF